MANKIVVLRVADIGNTWPKPTTCKECWGTGYVVCEYGHDHVCPECRGSGKIELTEEEILEEIENQHRCLILRRVKERYGTSRPESIHDWFTREQS